MRKLLIYVLVLSCFLSISATAQEAEPVIFPKGDFTELRLTSTATVESIIDPLRIRLKDKRVIQLAGLEIPDLDPYESGDIAVAAQESLKELLEGQTIRIYQTKKADKGRTNRMGHHLAHIERKEGDIWIQGALLSEGLARVYPTQRNPEMALQMLQIEQEAREAQKGLWKDEKYAVLTPETAEKSENGFAIVTGTVRSVATIRNTLYLNFGANWRTDFTISIKSAVRKKIARQGINLMNFGGKTVRVRGWLESYNGPHIKLIHPAWIEVLPEEEQDSNLGQTQKH